MKQVIKGIMVTLNQVYGKEQSEATFNFWLATMEGNEPKMVEKAFIEVARTKPIGAPTPGDVNEKIKELTGNDKTAQLAWHQVIVGIQKYGSYQYPIFRDVMISRVIAAMGGWGTICTMLESEQQWKEKEFCRNYEMYAEQLKAGNITAEELQGYSSKEKAYIECSYPHLVTFDMKRLESK